MIGKVSKVPWRFVVTAAATVAVLCPLMGVPQAAAASGASISQVESYRILTFADKCLTVHNNSATDSTPIVQFTCEGLFSQRFTFVPVGDGRFEIRTFANKCLTVREESTSDSARIDQFRCVDLFSQKFRILPLGDGRVEIHTFVDKCFTVRGESTAESVRIDQFRCVDLFSQKFRLQRL
ncbi:RICIN domain-containing protein [Streptomyces sp. CB02959]|uniref:RICIN domain-containing protein n=1 Tax=Streptomyces sp. CB02959 TaxID=2020330 RepID=UPI0015E0BBA3|nr:RICIN domain-containing protein [Streptomyces sp. CB02959]